MCPPFHVDRPLRVLLETIRFELDFKHMLSIVVIVGTILNLVAVVMVYFMMPV